MILFIRKDGVGDGSQENHAMTDQARARIVSVRDVLYVIFKRKKMIASIFLITVATVTVVVFLTKPVYEASVKVLLNREVTEAVLRVAPWIPLTRAFELEEEINSEIELIKSWAVMEAVIDHLDGQGLAESPSAPPEAPQVGVPGAEGDAEEIKENRLRRIVSLQRTIIAEPVKKSDVIQIRFSSGDPKRAMEIANLVADKYIDYRARIYRARGAVDFFNEQIEVARRNLDQLESALKDYRQQEAMLSYEKQESILLAKLDDFETSLTRVRKDIISKESKLAKIRDLMSSPLQPAVPSLEIREEQIISDLHDRLIDLRLRLNESLTKYTEDHREVQNLRSEIALGESELRAEVEKVVDLEESSLEALRAEEGALRSTVELLNAEVRTLPEKELTIQRLQRAIENHKEVYSMLVLKREEARIAEASDRRMTNVTVISPATLPHRPVKPQKGLSIFVACIIGLIGGFGLAFVIEFMDHSMRTSEDVEHYLNLPVLACIPEMKRS
jgi:uncharacterized protein involved in exopolysaccharide biosynthesis